MPPQSTACSPKRSVSTSSANVVVITPARGGQPGGAGRSGGVLVDRQQRRDAPAVDVDLAHAVARRLRRDEDDVDVRRGLDLAEVDREGMGDEEGPAASAG